jgi:hypothetical protein
MFAFAMATAVYNTFPPFADNDLWGHVYFGTIILANGRLPTTNLFSFTSPDHPWINHEILAECAFAAAFRHLGSPGLLGLKLMIGLATFGLLWRMIARRTDSLATTTLSLAACGSLLSPGFLARPQIFTLLGLAILWERIHRYDETRDWRSLVVLPALFALWINTHGGVVAGLGVLLVYVALTGVSGRRRSERLQLGLVVLLSTLALLANPYGANLIGFLWEDLGRTRAISEWQPLPLLGFPSLVFGSVLAVTAIGVLVGQPVRIWEVAMISAAAVMTLRHQRHLPLFGILAAPLLAEVLDVLARRAARVARIPSFQGAGRSLLAAGLCAVAIFEIVRVVDVYRDLRFNIFVDPELFPVDAVRFIKRNRLAGNLVVQSDWGEYAIWHLYPKCRVSFDGRYTTAYPEDVLELSHLFQAASPGWQSVLERGDLALISRQQRAVVSGMLEDEGWQYVYSDPTAFIFVRKSVANSRSFVRQPRTQADNAFFFP